MVEGAASSPLASNVSHAEAVDASRPEGGSPLSVATLVSSLSTVVASTLTLVPELTLVPHLMAGRGERAGVTSPGGSPSTTAAAAAALPSSPIAPAPPPIALGVYVGVGATAPRTPAAPEGDGEKDEELPDAPPVTPRERCTTPAYNPSFEPDTAQVYVGVSHDGQGPLAMPEETQVYVGVPRLSSPPQPVGTASASAGSPICAPHGWSAQESYSPEELRWRATCEAVEAPVTLFRAPSLADVAGAAGCGSVEADGLRESALSLAAGVARLSDALSSARAETQALQARAAERRFAAAELAQRLATATAQTERLAQRAAALERERDAARDALAAADAARKRLEGCVADGASEAAMSAQEAELTANLERLREAVRAERLRRSLRSAIGREFVCPITMLPFKDPVLAADGHSYERTAIEEWLNLHATSPLTNLPLPHKQLVPNRAIKSALESMQLFSGAAAGADAQPPST